MRVVTGVGSCLRVGRRSESRSRRASLDDSSICPVASCQHIRVPGTRQSKEQLSSTGTRGFEGRRHILEHWLSNPCSSFSFNASEGFSRTSCKWQSITLTRAGRGRVGRGISRRRHEVATSKCCAIMTSTLIPRTLPSQHVNTDKNQRKV